MGIIKCPIHGRQGFWEMCKHIGEAFENNSYPIMKELPGYPVKICNKCFKENNVGELKKISFDELLDLPEDEYNKYDEKLYPIYENLERRVKCFQCIKKVELNQAKQNNKELPFEAFENTLMFKDNEKIEELRGILTSNFKFQKFQNPYIKNQNAFHISSGGITYSFSIKIYYVTKQEDQNKLLKLIDNFFDKIPQKQRKISFYEAENWIIEEDGNKTHEYKGEEKLLLERIVK